jgi:hypothetical protein
MNAGAQTAEQYYESWAPPPITAADKQMRNTGTLSLRICDLPVPSVPSKPVVKPPKPTQAEKDALQAEARATRIAEVSKYEGDQLARAKKVEALVEARMPELLRLRCCARAGG